MSIRHHCDGRSLGGLGDFVLHNEEHVFVVQQPNKVETAEAGGGPKSQIPDHHRAVKAPLEQKLASSLNKVSFAVVLFEGRVYHQTQPSSPLFESVLLLKGDLKPKWTPL